jgi:hypothetical protein
VLGRPHAVDLLGPHGRDLELLVFEQARVDHALLLEVDLDDNGQGRRPGEHLAAGEVQHARGLQLADGQVLALPAWLGVDLPRHGFPADVERHVGVVADRWLRPSVGELAAGGERRRSGEDGDQAETDEGVAHVRVSRFGRSRRA